MALSGSFYKYATGSFGLYCTWSASQNIPGYYSDVTVNVYLQHYAISVGARANSTIKCGSEVYSYTASALSYASGTALTKTLLSSHTFRVYHDAGGGNKSVAVSAAWTFNGTYSGTYVGTITASDTIVLDAIPQQSAIASVSVDSNNKVTVNLTRYVDTFTHSVKFVFGNHSYTQTGVGASTNYTIPLDWLDAIPNSVTGIGSVQVTTYSGTSTVGNMVSKEFTVTVPATVLPAIGGITWTKTSSEPNSWPKVKNVSTGVLKMTGVAGIYGSTISSYSLTFTGLSSNTDSLTVNNITFYGELDAVAKVTDSRGRSFTKTVTFTVVDYAKPTLSVTACRCDSTGKEDASGEFMSIKAVAKVASVGDNTLSQLTVEYKNAMSMAYTKATLTSGTPFIVSASSNYTYNWIVTAADKVNTVSINGSVATGEVILDILADGTGIKIGGVAEEEGLHSAWDYTGENINAKNVVASGWVEAPIMNATDMSAECVYAGQLLVDNQDVVDHVIEQGTSGIWTYRKWSSGIAECWGSERFGGSVSTAWGSMFYLTVTPSAYPFTFVDYPVYHITPELNSDTSMWLAAEQANATKSKMGKFLAIRPTVATVDFFARYYVIGKWK